MARIQKDIDKEDALKAKRKEMAKKEAAKKAVAAAKKLQAQPEIKQEPEAWKYGKKVVK